MDVNGKHWNALDNKKPASHFWLRVKWSFREALVLTNGAEGRNSQKINYIINLLIQMCIFLNLNVNLYDLGRVSHMKCISKLKTFSQALAYRFVSER
jgi:hypothetical protein